MEQEPDLTRYPESVRIGANLLKLTKETAWTRVFISEDGSSVYIGSRIADGSAKISLQDVEQKWHNWTPQQQMDFARAISSASIESKAAIVKFILENGNSRSAAIIATSVPAMFPNSEALDLLSRACARAAAGEKRDFIQAVAALGGEAASGFVRDQHESLWNDPRRGQADGVNWVAIDCISTIKDLIELGFADREILSRAAYFLSHPEENTRACAKAVIHL